MGILEVITAITALLRIVDELESRGAALTQQQRNDRDDQRKLLNDLWAQHRAAKSTGTDSDAG